MNEQQKRQLKVSFIIVTIVIVMFIAAMSTVPLIQFIRSSHSRDSVDPMASCLTDIYTSYENKEYTRALGKISEFRNKYPDTERLQEISQIETKIDEEMYALVASAVDAENVEQYGDSYLSSFPNGAHATEVKEQLNSAADKLAPERIAEAKKQISQGDVLSADSLLKKVIDGHASPQYVQQAQQLSDGIAKQVEFETPLYVTVEDLSVDALKYLGRKIEISDRLLVISVDRERQMLYTCPISSGDTVDYDFPIEIYYGKMSNSSDWGRISRNDKVKIKVQGRFRIYANQKNSGYCEATSISKNQY